MTGNPILKTLAIAASAALLVTALAVPVMVGDDKVTICHKPGTPAEGTLEVSPSAVDAHLAHGDKEGARGVDPPPVACTSLPLLSGYYSEFASE